MEDTNKQVEVIVIPDEAEQHTEALADNLDKQEVIQDQQVVGGAYTQPVEGLPVPEAKSKPKWSCAFTFPEQKVPNNHHVITVEANNMGRALDLAFKQLRKTVLKGKKVKVATVGVVKAKE